MAGQIGNGPCNELSIKYERHTSTLLSNIKGHRVTSRDFCYWLQGYFEINGVETLTSEQAALIQKHLSLVFVHEIDPSFGKDNDHLNIIHNDGKLRPRC